MSDRRALRIALGLALLGFGCGHPEQKVVDQYFNALNAKDTQTLSSFAVVSLDTKDKRVDSWAITDESAQTRGPAPLVDLVTKMKDADAEVARNKKEANAYALDHLTEVDQVRELAKKGAKVPAKLAPHAAKWDEFNQKDRDAKKALAEAKDAVGHEERNVALSVGTTEGLEDMTGDMVTKQLGITLTIGGQVQNYAMALRKYEMTSKTQVGRATSRWIVYSFQAK